MRHSIAIIGAGAAGLAAARCLAAAGHPVVLLEAAAVAGGRIHSISLPGSDEGVEAGAEFVHGDLPVTTELAREANIPLVRTHHVQMNLTGDENGFGEPAYWDELMSEMSRVKNDLPVAEFMATHFSGEKYARLRDSVRRFAEGYDLADPAKASTKGLYAEWSAEEDSSEYRLEGGYGRLIQWLVGECVRLHVVLHFSSPVVLVRWREGQAGVVTASGQEFEAGAVLVTVAPPIVQQLGFEPAIAEHVEAASRIGWGSVIKILLEFRTAWWKKGDGKTWFILSRQSVPTWWTQPTPGSRLLTGWLTGENMHQFRKLDEKDRIEACLASLAGIFSMGIEVLRNELVAGRIFDWSEQPYVHGGYSYETVESPECRKRLQTPIMDTIYFAGEATDDGPSPGTVEAAFHSGLAAAEKIIARHKPRY